MGWQDSSVHDLLVFYSSVPVLYALALQLGIVHYKMLHNLPEIEL